MFLHLVGQSLLRQRRRKLTAALAVTLGIALTTAMVAVATDVGDRMGEELRTYGANIVVNPKEDTLDLYVSGVSLKPPSDGAYLQESELPKIKQIFWAHNIRGYTPILPTPVQLGPHSIHAELIGTYFAKQIPLRNGIFTTGVTKTHPWWKIEGEWPADDSTNVAMGKTLAAKLRLHAGDYIEVAGSKRSVSGIVTTGGAEDNAIIAPIALVQAIMGRPGAVRRVYISALIKPEDDFARRNPASMSPELLERWSCSPYANSIAYQINQAIPSAHAEQIRLIAQNEGILLTRISGVMLLITAGALLAALLTISTAMASSVMERRSEIGLMKALGAGNATIIGLFLAEAICISLVGGSAGFVIGEWAASRVGNAVFGISIQTTPILFPIVLASALVIAVLGTLPSLRKASSVQPSLVLRGAAA